MPKQDQSFQGRKLFKGRDTSWGIFYPTDYIIAIFDSLASAQRAKEIMLAAGYAEGEVDAVPSDYVIADIEAGRKNATLLTRVRQQISKALGAEAEFWEEDLRFAKQGAGFLAIRCATADEAERALRLLQPVGPEKMRRYGRASIQELVQSSRWRAYDARLVPLRPPGRSSPGHAAGLSSPAAGVPSSGGAAGVSPRGAAWTLLALSQAASSSGLLANRIRLCPSMTLTTWTISLANARSSALAATAALQGRAESAPMRRRGLTRACGRQAKLRRRAIIPRGQAVEALILCGRGLEGLHLIRQSLGDTNLREPLRVYAVPTGR